MQCVVDCFGKKIDRQNTDDCSQPMATIDMANNAMDHRVITVEEREAEQEIQQQKDIKDLLQLLHNKQHFEHNIEDACPIIEQIRNILLKNKSLINYRYCKENKVRSILHIVKYNSKLLYKVKQQIIDAVVDVGYTIYTSTTQNNFKDNCNALFFIAAKSDSTALERIIQYFKEIGREDKLHDTREGDSVLSFMLKFGNYAQRDYINCFNRLLNENIDVDRIDYYKNNIASVIEKENYFLEKIGSEHIATLHTIQDFIKIKKVAQGNVSLQKIRNKHQLFQSIIQGGAHFKNLLRSNLDLVDADDGENTLLQLCVIKNTFDAANELLQKGANPNHIVSEGNEELPILLAAKLMREGIFREILQNKQLRISKSVFVKFIIETKTKYFNYLLESNKLDVTYHYKDKTPLYYAIIRKNRKAVQCLLQGGARLTDNCLTNINPKDLEEYLNSCIKFDSFKEDMEESDYKPFLVFDFFINYLSDTPSESDLEPETKPSSPNLNKECESEIQTLRKIGSTKRLKYLLEHPLIYTFIILKWYCVLKYYYCFVFCKFIFYLTIFLLVYIGSFDSLVLVLVILIQFVIVFANFTEFKFEWRRYTLHFVLEISILSLLIAIFLIKVIDHTSVLTTQCSAFVIIITSISMLLTLGYHVDLSKWMSMAKRVFRNFGILLIFFILPILAFATAFKMLLPPSSKDDDSPLSNEDFQNLPRSIFRTFVMLSGDVGDKKFFLWGGYVVFLLFSIGMAIIIMNFWTGVAVSDIKEIEEQSTIVAFNNIVVFIESVEEFYKFFVYNLFKKCFSSRTCHWIRRRIPSPFLKSKVAVKKSKKTKVHYGVDLYINSERPFRNNEHFDTVILGNDIISKIKSLYDEKDLNIQKTLKQLVEKIEEIENNYVKKSEQFEKSMETFENMYKKLSTYEGYFKQLLEAKHSSLEHQIDNADNKRTDK